VIWCFTFILDSDFALFRHVGKVHSPILKQSLLQTLFYSGSANYGSAALLQAEVEETVSALRYFTCDGEFSIGFKQNFMFSAIPTVRRYFATTFNTDDENNPIRSGEILGLGFDHTRRSERTPVHVGPLTILLKNDRQQVGGHTALRHSSVKWQLI